MKVFYILLVSLGLVFFFQNCANNDQVSFSEISSIAPSSSDATAQEEIVSSEPAAPVQPASTPAPVAPQQVQSCFPVGYVFTTGDSLPYIHYHKCDGEMEMWRRMGESQCCSRKVTIEDIESYDYPTCPRFRGRMTCAGSTPLYSGLNWTVIIS